ncbi:hypothetical protein G7Y31_03630 [Corynebacterium lizhenjunii]|uniref:Uncharacterized protein n=1 Tax=Corynebacterium lizhenjunii TaxID=2709394 RepID=A0A7T0KFV8_9CORY|nr:hypothetical protein [Corynebacterium lizhenjunii]QPK79799.1 hypothetical protein G7Y31_03630 [Corynebacterium lizhenjunii]
MAEQHPRRPRSARRRAVRKSDAVDYDRSADRPEFHSAFDTDGNRLISLDRVSDEEPASHDAAFYEEQRPPHYGQ